MICRLVISLILALLMLGITTPVALAHAPLGETRTLLRELKGDLDIEVKVWPKEPVAGRKSEIIIRAYHISTGQRFRGKVLVTLETLEPLRERGRIAEELQKLKGLEAKRFLGARYGVAAEFPTLLWEARFRFPTAGNYRFRVDLMPPIGETTTVEGALEVKPRMALIPGLPSWPLYGASGLILVISFIVFSYWGIRRREGFPAFSYDLLKLPKLGNILRWRPLRPLLSSFTVFLFLLIIYAGFAGDQGSASNIAPLLTWTYWWILLVFLILFLGKAWCFICPWDALSSWVERVTSRFIPALRRKRPWPRFLRNIYLAAFLFLLLTWLELGYGVTTRPWLTAVLGLIILALALVPTLIYERRSFCRYGCLVGRVSGLYALFAPVELRAKDKEICRNHCQSHDCFQGNERGKPCPTFQFLGTMGDNTYCTLCTECLRTCPKNNVAINVRPFARDLLNIQRPRFDEAALAVIMLTMTSFHGLTMIPQWFDMTDTIQINLGISYTWAFTLGMAGSLAALASFFFGFVFLSKFFSRDRMAKLKTLLLNYSYSLLPIALFYHFAHNTMHFFREGQRIVPMVSDPFGWGWDLFGTAATNPEPLLSLPVIWGLQVTAIIIGHVFALFVAHNTSFRLFQDRSAALRSQVPMLVLMILYSTFSLWLVAQPMEMRTAM